MPSKTKPPLWPHNELARIAEEAISATPTPDTFKRDYDALRLALRNDLNTRNISIANDHAATDYLCGAASATYLAAKLRDQLDTLIRREIANARHNGATWADIGSAFGITPRRAMEVFNESTIESRRAYEEKRGRTRSQPSLF